MSTQRRLGSSIIRLGCLLVWLVALAGAPPAAAAGAALDNAGCLRCHGAEAAKIESKDAQGKAHPLRAVSPEPYAQGVHGRMTCVACHAGITDMPAAGSGHAGGPQPGARTASCAECHEKLWKEAQQAGTSKPRLRVVAQNVQNYRQSFHARPQKDDPSKPNAVCDDCHDTHTFNVPPATAPEKASWRLGSPALCGERCHTEQLETYRGSVHGKELLDKHNAKSAACSDCHTAHSVGNTSASPIKLAITANCGNCHAANYKSYKATYHGQISTLGYANTAKCFDCHGSHDILAVKNPESKVHPNNRLDTCKECHGKKDKAGPAPVGFLTFQPHANTDDFAHYPQVWLGYRMMVGLLVGTFAFFWLHTALWFYRELMDRRRGASRPHVALASLPADAKGRHFKRFSAMWRVAHLSFAVSLMILTLTGMPLFYPDAAWAPVVMKALGGPKVAGTIHRAFALVFAGVFLWHLVVIAGRIWRNRSTFRIFGPESLVPGLQDMRDIVAMFKWFFGKGPRPVFDHWTYWEKFDYWAPFWGVTIIGVSGLMMWLPHLTGSYLPGWVFNVAAIFHGEEAFLAVVFLFTVHFFNNHFRPDKFPLDIVMFTGTMPIEHYRKEHALEYARLAKSGQLRQYIVDAPSAPMTLGSKVLGFTLITVGLILLFGVAVGFFTNAG
jgi:cytochrome b subunit of formate dehydrogenase